MQVDVAFYESADYYDRLHRASREAKTRPLALLESIGALSRNGITFLAMAVVLLPYGVWLPLALVVGTVPAFVVLLRFNRRYHAWWERTTSDRRLAEYDDTILSNSNAAAELRLFDLGGYYSSAFQSLRRRLRGERLSLSRDQNLARLVASAVALAVSGLTMIYMIRAAIAGAATLGDLALFYQAFNQGQGLLRSLLANVGEIYGNSFFLGNLFEFLALQPRIFDPAKPVPLPADLMQGIHFRHVTFHYPGSTRAALRDFSLEIPARRITAIVGANGAGKSTLIKLLCRFYDPAAGCVQLDGLDLRELSLTELRRRISVLFQFPLTYYATAGQNIAVGDLASAPTMAEIVAAALAAGAHELIARLPNGYDTTLGTAFGDGIDLSGGEWQRIALARAFLRQAPIIILDEPTSFMDSWAEADWLERFRDLVRGRTVLIITHRFTTAKYADIIHVMQDGQVIQSGSHDELVAGDGLYARSWARQMAHSQTSTIP
jgi:ATP-binding cassette subfamily B protein